METENVPAIGNVHWTVATPVARRVPVPKRTLGCPGTSWQKTLQIELFAVSCPDARISSVVAQDSKTDVGDTVAELGNVKGHVSLMDLNEDESPGVVYIPNPMSTSSDSGTVTVENAAHVPEMLEKLACGLEYHDAPSAEMDTESDVPARAMR
jgi:hypothetical protein